MSSRFTIVPNTEKGIRAPCLESTDVRKIFPWVVWGPSPPFALGAVWAVCASETYALAIASALERSREVANRAIEDERKATAKALMKRARMPSSRFVVCDGCPICEEYGLKASDTEPRAGACDLCGDLECPRRLSA